MTTGTIPPLVAVRVADLQPDDIVFIHARDHSPVRGPTHSVHIPGWSGTTAKGCTNDAQLQPAWDLDGRAQPRALLEINHHGFNVAWGLGTVLSQCIANLRHGQRPLLPQDELEAPGEPVQLHYLAMLYGAPVDKHERYAFPDYQKLYADLPLTGRPTWGQRLYDPQPKKKRR